MKAIIIAAGLGSRMREMTQNRPKCMIEFSGKPLLQIQLETLRSLGIDDISVVTGYLKDKVTLSGVRYFVNDDYENNNILESLFYAEEALDGPVIVSYCDILYRKEVVEKLMQDTQDISLVVDTHWKDAYQGRSNHPLSEAESVVFDDQRQVQKIGKMIEGNKEDMPGEFIGMFKLSEKGADMLKTCYHDCKQKYVGQAFQKAASFRKAYITDIMQELVDRGQSVSCSLIEGGWREIDTIEDFNNAEKILKEVSYA